MKLGGPIFPIGRLATMTTCSPRLTSPGSETSRFYKMDHVFNRIRFDDEIGDHAPVEIKPVVGFR